MLRLVVLISGNGSNLQAIIDACQSGKLKAEIACVISNKLNAFGLERAQKAGIPTLVKTLLSYKKLNKTRQDYDKDLAQDIIAYKPDLIVLAGFMHIVSKDFIDALPLIINLHPALPGAFDGAHAIERAFKAYQDKEITETGVMVHQVIPQVDRGPVLMVERVEILPTDTLEDLEQRIHKVEHKLLVEAIISISEK